MQIEIDVVGDKQVSRELISRGDRAMHPAPFFNAAADFLMRVERAQFGLDGAYASGGWDDLADSTIAQKRRKGYAEPERPLHGSGRLERSLTQRGNPLQKLQISEHQMVFGSWLSYLKYHQRGAQALRYSVFGRPLAHPVEWHLPQRRVLELTTLDRKRIERAASLWVARGTLLKGFGGLR
jgi:phage gpG-like protein